MEEGFVPSYKNEEELQKQRIKAKKQYRIRIIIAVVIVAVIICAIAFVSYTLATLNYKKYEHYEDKMNIYGFSKVYNDGDAKTSDKVTKSEAVKMILSCLYNVPKLDGIALPTEETYSNAIWVEYAIKKGIISREEVNASNANDKVKYQEVLVWLYNIKAKVLNIEPDTEEKIKIKDINAYNTDQRLAILDLYNSEIITTNTARVNGKQKLFKGKLNELVVNFAEKYNTITVGNAKININEDKIPDNADKYPYTLASVQKDVYEIPFKNDGKDGFISPIDYYKDNKQYYGQIKTYVEAYYNAIINVDSNLTATQLDRKLKKYAFEKLDETELQKYVDYVKANNIKITGTATAQMPCVYFDGTDYRVRVKLEIKVESSNTNTDLLLGDKGVNYDIKNPTITVYIDSILNKDRVSETLFIKDNSVFSILAKSSSSIISGGK